MKLVDSLEIRLSVQIKHLTLALDITSRLPPASLEYAVVKYKTEGSPSSLVKHGVLSEHTEPSEL